MPRSVYYLPDTARRVIISKNPNAGSQSGQRQTERLIELLRESDYQVEMVTDLDEMARLANKWHQNGELRALVAAGGDGTVAELINRTEPGVPISVLPLGTENLLSKFLGMRRDAEAVVEVIQEGIAVKMDAARGNDRIFFLMATCGLDAAIINLVDQQRTGHIHHLSYIKPILGLLRSYQYPAIRVYFLERSAEPSDTDQQTWVDCRWAQVFNFPNYALGLKFIPSASPLDGRLDVCWYQRGRIWNMLRYYLCVLFKMRGCILDRRQGVASRLRIESEQTVPYQLDGDAGGNLPLEIEALPERFSVLVPRKWVERTGLSIEEKKLK